jgi:hypothetical protein
MVLLSFVLLMIMVVLNRSARGMWIVGLGVLMNFVVIAANGGMPVLAGAAEVASGFTVTNPDLSGTFKHVILDESSRLTFFADVIPLRLGGIGEVISLGDVFLLEPWVPGVAERRCEPGVVVADRRESELRAVSVAWRRCEPGVGSDADRAEDAARLEKTA